MEPLEREELPEERPMEPLEREELPEERPMEPEEREELPEERPMEPEEREELLDERPTEPEDRDELDELPLEERTLLPRELRSPGAASRGGASSTEARARSGRKTYFLGIERMGYLVGPGRGTPGSQRTCKWGAARDPPVTPPGAPLAGGPCPPPGTCPGDTLSSRSRPRRPDPGARSSAA